MSEEGKLESDQLWERIDKRDKEENWCEWDTLTGEWQDYVIALQTERENAIVLLGKASHLLTDAMALLKQWLNQTPYMPPQFHDVAQRTAAFLKREAGTK